MDYATNEGVFYPNVVTLSQIYSMMCQRYIEDGVTMENDLGGEGEGEEDEDEDEAAVEMEERASSPSYRMSHRYSRNTAVERASMQARRQKGKLFFHKETIISLANKSKAGGKELFRSFFSILVTFGKHYSMFFLFFYFSIFYFSP